MNKLLLKTFRKLEHVLHTKHGNITLLCFSFLYAIQFPNELCFTSQVGGNADLSVLVERGIW
jgi:hypothetical protein